MRLLETLDKAIETHGLRHLTLAPTADGQWQAAYMSASPGAGYSVAISIDPECALIGALSGDNTPDRLSQLDLELLG